MPGELSEQSTMASHNICRQWGVTGRTHSQMGNHIYSEMCSIERFSFLSTRSLALNWDFPRVVCERPASVGRHYEVHLAHFDYNLTAIAGDARPEI